VRSPKSRFWILVGSGEPRVHVEGSAPFGASLDKEFNQSARVGAVDIATKNMNELVRESIGSYDGKHVPGGFAGRQHDDVVPVTKERDSAQRSTTIHAGWKVIGNEDIDRVAAERGKAETVAITGNATAGLRRFEEKAGGGEPPAAFREKALGVPPVFGT
jgi:hypothetical protein